MKLSLTLSILPDRLKVLLTVPVNINLSKPISSDRLIFEQCDLSEFGSIKIVILLKESNHSKGLKIGYIFVYTIALAWRWPEIRYLIVNRYMEKGMLQRL